ncbi:helix-turn-helix domain-containing protein [Nonomuraea wenchangensis]|uniref:helix-turn-helix domain-containing protein n=1 Tax=Nonomuraea wenchangensis TaxID=568860 RepID=UPI00331C42D9
MASPGLSPELMEAEAAIRRLTGMCLRCGTRSCSGCWNPLAENPQRTDEPRQTWSLPLTEADRRRIRTKVVRQRQRLGISIQEVAAHIEVSYQAVSRWERHYLYAIGDNRIVAVAELLDAAEREADEAGLPSPKRLRARMLRVLERYQMARSEFAVRAGVTPGCVARIAEAPVVRHYREVLAIVRALDEISVLPPPAPRRSHGTLAAYIRGCRCPECTTANREHHRASRTARSEVSKADPAKVPHGDSGYTNWNCRCEVCKAAGSELNRRKRLRRKASAAGRPNP